MAVIQKEALKPGMIVLTDYVSYEGVKMENNLTVRKPFLVLKVNRTYSGAVALTYLSLNGSVETFIIGNDYDLLVL